jgi:hypothetical protein
MVLSNAERQARYRKSIKARANDPGASARTAADAAVAALWGFLVRADAAGQKWGEKEGFDTLEQYRASLEGGHLVETCRSWGDQPEEGMTDDEFRAIRAVVEIDDAAKLRHGKGD